MKMDISAFLSPNLRKRWREFSYRLRGIHTTPLGAHEVAALVNRPDPVILDIGCNDGGDTRAMLQAMPGAHIYCFEPEPRAIRRFRERMGADIDRVRLFEGAVSDRTGRVDFHASSGGEFEGGWDQSGSIRRPKNHLKEWPWCTFETTIAVESVRLDDWCAQNGVDRIDFLWMDVQGAEVDVIRGGPRAIERTRFLYFEYSNTETYEGEPPLKDLLALLPSFQVIKLYPNDVLLRNVRLG